MSNIIFNKLLTINLTHEYYANGICNDLRVQATPQTISLLAGYGILFKPTNLGAVLLYESLDETGTPKIPIENPIKLSFLFSSSSAYFTNFTEVEFSDDTNSLYYLSSNDPGIVVSGNTRTIVDGKLNEPIPIATKNFKIEKSSSAVNYFILTDEDNTDYKIAFKPVLDYITVDMAGRNEGKYELKQYDSGDVQVGDSYTFYYNDKLSGVIPFAVFELFIDAGDTLSLPLNFNFDFKSRETYWRYKVLLKEAVPRTTDFTVDASTLSITHTPNEGDTISFNSASGSEPITIRSTDKIKLKEKGFEQIGLYHGEENILISNLPNPSPVKLEKTGTDWYSDIYVYVYI